MTDHHVRLDHVGIAVADRAPVVEMLRDILGGSITWHDWPDPDRRGGFLATHIVLEGTMLEIIEPSSPKSFLVRYLERRGPGLHHLTWLAEEMPELVARLESEGCRIIDQIYRDDELIDAFIHPATAYGVLTQFRPGWWRRQDRSHLPSTQGLPGPIPTRGFLHHVTIAQSEREPALTFFQRILGGEAPPAERYGDFWGGPLLSPEPGPKLGFIAPAESTGFLARYLAERGPGIHHLAFKLHDMEGAIAAAEARGLRFINRRPAEGPVDDIFLHPNNPTGALLRFQRLKAEG